MGQQGGWPLTMFLTPDGAPMFGGTYWPPTPRWGRPSFTQILHAGRRGVARQSATALTAQGAELFDHLAAMARTRRRPRSYARRPDARGEPADAPARSRPWRHRRRAQIPQRADLPLPLERTFPPRRRRGRARRCARLLDALCEGGIYDHLGGGFARYSTDAEWHVPHFEKMLYDNAQILELLALAHAETPDPALCGAGAGNLRLADRAKCSSATPPSPPRRTPTRTARKVCFSSGASTRSMPRSARTAPAFKAAYDVTPGGNWEGRNVLRRRQRPAATRRRKRRSPRARARLFALREARPKPARDDKVLADWNGLMIAALARAAAASTQPGWLVGRARRLRLCRRELARRRRAASPMPGATGASARRACSTTTRAWRAPRWRCSRRPGEPPISSGAIERAARRAGLVWRRRRQLVPHRARRRGRARRPAAPRARRRDALGRRPDGRGPGAPVPPDRRSRAGAPPPET